MLPDFKSRVIYSQFIGESNGTPLQYSCLENPIGRGAWWAVVHGVTESDMTEQLSLSLLVKDLLCCELLNL